jgi:hypothetical protein
MNITTTSGRGRLLAGLLATSALAVSGLAATGGPAQSADPAGDCAVAYPVADLTQHQVVSGKTVSSGVAPEDFSGEVLGVLDSGIAPGLDMIIVRLDSPEIQRVGGIWQGMSGSPVYAQDGRLIGAVSYGLAWGASPVAGVTPFEDMDDYLATAAPLARIKVGDSMARTIARNSDVTTTEASQGFRQLPMPVSASGISQSRLSMGKHGRHYLRDLKTAQAGGASASFGSGTAADIVAGGNLAAGLSYGDVTMAGVGTATSVCDGRVVGFGHPMSFLGSTTLGLMPADAIYVQEDPLGPPFKLANVGMPAGTITDDHLTGITGTFGATPPETVVTAQASYRDRGRTGESHSLVQDSLADLFFAQNLGNSDRVIDGIHGGSADRTYSASGTDAEGAPFTVSLDDLYQSDYDISGDAVWGEADLTWYLSRMDGVTVDSIDTTASYTDDTTVWTVKKLAVKMAGQWITVGRKDTLRVRPGQTLQMRGSLASATGTTQLPFTVKVPAVPKGQYGVISLTGGSDFYPRGLSRAQTPQDLIDVLAKAPRNDQAVGELDIFGRRTQVSSSTTDPLGTVIRGAKYVQVKVKF